MKWRLEYLSTINLYNDRDLVSFDYLNQYAGRLFQLFYTNTYRYNKINWFPMWRPRKLTNYTAVGSRRLCICSRLFIVRFRSIVLSLQIMRMIRAYQKKDGETKINLLVKKCYCKFYVFHRIQRNSVLSNWMYSRPAPESQIMSIMVIRLWWDHVPMYLALCMWYQWESGIMFDTEWDVRQMWNMWP